MENAVYVIMSTDSNKCLDSADPDGVTVGKWDWQNESQGQYRFGEEIYNRQLWTVKKIEGAEDQKYYLKSVDSGKYLDSADPGGVTIGKWFGQDDYIRHKWRITKAHDDNDSFYVQSVESGKYLDSADPDGATVGKWDRQDDYIRHKWQFMKQDNFKNGLNYADVKNLIMTTITLTITPAPKIIFYKLDRTYLPLTQYQFASIWQNSSIPGKIYRKESFDCDDFSFVMKSSVSLWGYDNSVQNNVLSPICGIMIAKPNDPEKPNHAFNFYINHLGKLFCFEPQKGEEVQNYLTEYSISHIIV